MPIYHKLGKIPQKRHVVFKSDAGNFYYEQLFGTEGFNSHSSLLYHIHPPTQIIHTDEPIVVAPKVAEEKMLKHRSFEGFNVQPEADYLNSRKAV